MGNSVVAAKYDTYVFDPVPQIGVRDNVARIGDLKYGPGTKESTITLVGVLEGNNHNEVMAKIVALRAALSKFGKTFYWHDGVAIRLNGTVQPLSVDIPDDWQQYEAKYTINLLYYPRDETQWNHGITACSYNGYTFNPIPILGREYNPNRESEAATRHGSVMEITLSGFFDKGSYANNIAEYNLLLLACATDGTLAYGVPGGWTQACRFNRLSTAPDIGDVRISYTVVLEYDLDYGTSGVTKMSSSRTVESEERDAIDYVPFMDDGQVQPLGRSAQKITANGYVTAKSLAEAKAAAAAELTPGGWLFPGTLNVDCVEPTRTIEEDPEQKTVRWNVVRVYPIPLLTGALYGAAKVF